MSFVRTLATSAVALALATGGAFAQEIQLKLHHFLSPKAPAHTQMLEPWAKKIEEASEGRVKIEIFPAMTLGGKPPQLPRQARDGVVDLVWIVNAYAAGAFPRTEVFELPGVHRGDNAAVNKAMLAMYDEFLAEDFQGVVPMFQHVHQGQAIHMASEEVRSPADLAGKKIRIPSRTGSWVLEALGASPVQTAVGEIPVALSKKVIDGALIPWEIIPALKIHEVTDYQIEGPGGKRFGTTSFSVLMNEAKWDSLPEDIQAIFREASDEAWHAEVGEVWANADAHGIEVATGAGNTHIQLTDEEWAAFEEPMSTVVTRWIEEMNGQGIDGQALYDKAVELVGQNMQTN
ncbi:TRAP transporter substrate-binding protein [Vannielia litorea]|uniref:TRAP transporter substrate-binding protein n=1 Tax=Vannielia litorea TaxID=1217970 RepID=UPI001C969FF4|nr:TRAP transporter substrate-binding protein [Vannielia litorea]MBY6049020.1 TRAP transporter substrate-binding protein [Vannielia litorea]MBY6076434.1 TRAP transporter substrate-binding protein [Vannielia litorea]